MTPFDAYCMYLALKLHFNSEKYDYLKYNGKTGAKQDSFETRRDKYQFYRLSKVDDLERYLVANFFESTAGWVGDLLGDKARENYTAMKARQQALTYTVERELNLIDNLKDAIKCDGRHPDLLKDYKRGDISPETLILLDREMGLIDYWNRKIDETYIWPSISLRLRKYAPFVHFDRKKFREILRNYINSIEDRD